MESLPRRPTRASRPLSRVGLFSRVRLCEPRRRPAVTRLKSLAENPGAEQLKQAVARAFSALAIPSALQLAILKSGPSDLIGLLRITGIIGVLAGSFYSVSHWPRLVIEGNRPMGLDNDEAAPRRSRLLNPGS